MEPTMTPPRSGGPETGPKTGRSASLRVKLLAVLEELSELAKGFATLAQWEEHIARVREELARQAKERNENPDSVSLSTMHSSKGLEYRIVFLIDANEGITPHRRTVFEEDMEEGEENVKCKLFLQDNFPLILVCLMLLVRVEVRVQMEEALVVVLYMVGILGVILLF